MPSLVGSEMCIRDRLQYMQQVNQLRLQSPSPNVQFMTDKKQQPYPIKVQQISQSIQQPTIQPQQPSQQQMFSQNYIANEIRMNNNSKSPDFYSNSLPYDQALIQQQLLIQQQQQQQQQKSLQFPQTKLQQGMILKQRQQQQQMLQQQDIRTLQQMILPTNQENIGANNFNNNSVQTSMVKNENDEELQQVITLILNLKNHEKKGGSYE
eukprot:TRINITY_DN1478_c0_g1_i2.p3 TRINITY_DN1478_c0_g1~~TRINITY_DN1478_c0_g1_i2.p3  ORF type:complete len:209 (+),score=49.65 TRINITY_DN1478_c0_g1_i2:55-681(+)